MLICLNHPYFSPAKLSPDTTIAAGESEVHDWPQGRAAGFLLSPALCRFFSSLPSFIYKPPSSFTMLCTTPKHSITWNLKHVKYKREGPASMTFTTTITVYYSSFFFFFLVFKRKKKKEGSTKVICRTNKKKLKTRNHRNQ